MASPLQFQADMPLDMEARRALIAELEKARSTRVIVCFLGDRPGLQTPLGEDTVRTIYDHVRAIGRTRQLDLVLHSSGGGMDAPWRLVTMLREHAGRLEVLVPHRAQSAATMVCLGADAIVMGPRAELGAVDAQIGCVRFDGEHEIEEQVGVEDLMAFLRFLRRRVGASAAAVVSPLTDEMPVRLIGQAERMRVHVRSLVGKLLALRAEQPDEATRRAIFGALAGRVHPHGHAIVRREAREMGLPVVEAPPEIEARLWRLNEAYEEACEVRTPFDARAFLDDERDVRVEPVVLGFIESSALAHHLVGEVKAVRRREPPEQINLTLNLDVHLAPGLEAGSQAVAAEAAALRVSAELEPRLRQLISDELRRQMPSTGLDTWTQGQRWMRLR